MGMRQSKKEDGLAMERKELQMELEARARQIEHLSRYIPGGMHQCRDDEKLTLVSMSDSFTAMLGYTREEIQELFENQFINLIYPKDRESVAERMRKQLENGAEIELEYRILCKDGCPVWFLDKSRLCTEEDGNRYFYSLLIQNTERKREQEELRLSLERHRVIMDQTTDIIFEWDLSTDQLDFSQNWVKKFGYAPISNDISRQIPLSRDIHSEDMPVFLKIMRNTLYGVPYSEAEFRIRNSRDEYVWCCIRVTTQFDEQGNAIKAVGVIIDIDSQKKQKEKLLKLAQNDALTGLYNKMTVNRLIEQKMLEGFSRGFHVLLIIDIDCFKEVNDTYGHLSGDSVLSDVAAVLKTHIRKNDLAGRIGGDEFLVYLTEMDNEDAVENKAETLLLALKEIIPEKGAPSITCSIGAAIADAKTKDYSELFRQADQALYYRKKNGRNGIQIYHKEMSGILGLTMSKESAIGAFIGTNENVVADEQLAQYAFRMLYSAEDIEAALNKLLEIIGRAYDVSRAYIFESLEDPGYTSITFEWCSKGVSPQKELLQHISYHEDLGDYQANFNEKGLFFCQDIRKLHPDLYRMLDAQGIKSMLQCAILDDGKFIGGVGFDECRENRQWSANQLAAFKLTADVLANSVLKLRLKQRLQKALEGKL